MGGKSLIGEGGYIGNKDESLVAKGIEALGELIKEKNDSITKLEAALKAKDQEAEKLREQVKANSFWEKEANENSKMIEIIETRNRALEAQIKVLKKQIEELIFPASPAAKEKKEKE